MIEIYVVGDPNLYVVKVIDIEHRFFFGGLEIYYLGEHSIIVCTTYDVHVCDYEKKSLMMAWPILSVCQLIARLWKNGGCAYRQAVGG